MTTPVRVLLVDDHDLVRGGMAAILRADPGIRVVAEAANGPQAVHETVQHTPDIVLMDIEMPGGDGITATAEIVATCPSTKVLILTTFDLDEYVYQALRAGASGFLLKTTPPAELARAIHACSEGETLLSPSVTRRLVETFVAQRPSRPSPALDTLTAREIDILREVATGKSNAEIAAALYLGEGTVKTHLTHILAKLDLRDRVQAVVIAYETGLVITRPGHSPAAPRT
ncbi:MAG: response regulator transcription factor [Nocardioidaceae bacterium]